MRKFFLGLAAALALALAGGGTLAGSHGGWVLNGERSSLAFGSVKKDSVGETHFFRRLSGRIGADGQAVIEIDLGSVDTNVEIRDERVIEHLFENAPSARVSVSVEMADLPDLPVGEMTTIYLDGTLSFLGREIPVEADAAVIRLAEDRVMVASEGMLWLTTEEMGFDAGVSRLQEIVELPSITRAFPVTFRLVFERGM